MAKVTIRVLGCGDAFGSGGRFQTSFFVTVANHHVLIDCGATILVAMRRFHVDPTLVDTVVLSHLHGDHFGGLPFLLLEAQFASRRNQPLRIIGPDGTQDRLRQALEVMYPGSSEIDWRFPLSIAEFTPGRIDTIGPIEITPYAVEHPSGAPSLAFRLDCGGKTIAFSGDTGWTETLIEVARQADLFVTECYSYTRTVPHHLDLQTLVDHRDQLAAKRIVLTHMGQDMLDHLDRLDLDRFEVAEDGLLIQL